jgi:ferredoxin
MPPAGIAKSINGTSGIMIERNTPATVNVNLEPVGRRALVARGSTLLEAAQPSGVELVAVCGGQGICGTCRVRHAGGDVTPLTSTEEAIFTDVELADGFRLACQAEALGDARVDIPPDSLTSVQRLQLGAIVGQAEPLLQSGGDFRLSSVVERQAIRRSSHHRRGRQAARAALPSHRPS